MSCGLDDPGLDSRQGQDIFLFYRMSRSHLGPTHSPIERVTFFFFAVGKAVKRLGVNFTSHFHVVRMSRAVWVDRDSFIFSVTL